MKKLFFIILFVFIYSTCISQNLSLNEIFTLCSKPNWDVVNEYMLKKGWEYYESSKGDDTHYNKITWSYKKSFYEDKAQGWFFLYTYEDFPNKITFSFFNKQSYNTIKNGITAAGMKLIDNSIEDNEIITKYSGLSYIVTVATAKREKEDYSDNSITAYTVTVIKKAGVYDKDNGLKKTFDNDGNLETEYILKDGEINGLGKYYYPNGNVKIISNFINGVKQGLSKEYDEDGIIEAEYTYVNNELTGIYKLYENGKLSLIGNYSNGAKNGKFKSFKSDGTIDNEYIMKNDSLISFSGLQKSCDSNGNLDMEYTLKDSKLNGIAKSFFSNGKLKVVSSFINGKKQGLSKEYDEDGNLISEYNYINGESNGIYKIYENNKIKIIGSLLNDEKNGLFKEYDDNNLLNLEYNMKLGMLDGAYTEYVYNESKLLAKITGYFNNDKKNGLWQTIKYIEKGTDIISSHTYIDGIKNGAFKEVKSDSIIFGTYRNNVLEGTIDIYTNIKSLLIGGLYGDTTNSPLVESGTYSNGLKSGYWKYYSLSKNLIKEGRYYNGLETGEWKYYFDNYSDDKNKLLPYSGKLFLIENYEYGKKSGKETRYAFLKQKQVPCDATGNSNINPLDTCHEMEYQKIFQTSYFKNGELHGPFQEKDSIGITIFNGNFIYGKKDGLWTESYISKDIEDKNYYIFLRGNYANGLETGIWEEFSDVDFIYTKYTYSKGKLNGKTTNYSKNNIISEVKYFEDGNLKKLDVFDSLGIHIKRSYDILYESNYSYSCKKTEFYDYGKAYQVYNVKKDDYKPINHSIFELLFAIKTGKYSDGSGYEDGEFKEFDNKGNIIVEGNVYKKIKTGIWKEYYFDSNVYTVIEYNNNIGGIVKYYEINSGKLFSGKFIQNYKNGITKFEIKISDGLRDGKSKYYDKSGKIEKTEKYEAGILKI